MRYEKAIRLYQPHIANKVLGREVNGTEALKISCAGKNANSKFLKHALMKTVSMT